MARQAPPCRFYLLTPPVIDLPAFSEALKAALDADDDCGGRLAHILPW